MEDIISQLPDDILISIITRIPTKDALRSSILSKRWRNLFRFVPAFNFFCDHRYSDPTCHSKAILEGVHGLLERHHAFIRSFHLCCCLTESCTHPLEQCIYSLGKLGIENLSLWTPKNWSTTRVVSFSCHLLSHMPSLKHFTLKSCFLQPNLKNPCNSLKTLKLSKVKGPPGYLECILSNCLNLCSLAIKDCQVPSKLCFHGPNLQLKCIVIHECEGVKEIELYASNLMTFEFKFDSDEMVNFIFDYVPQLQNIYLCLLENGMPSLCRRLGQDLPHLKTLLVQYMGDPFEDGGIDMGITMFNNLNRLELNISYLSTFNLFSLIPLLHGCPLLQELHLSVRPRYYNLLDEEKHVVLHPHLKNVEINGFGGTKHEIEFALYILKSAVRLQLMDISWHSSYYDRFGRWYTQDDPPIHGNKFSEIYQSIQQLKHEAVSPTVQVIFQKFARIVPKQF
ncbi:hypothetical protein DH2020_043289 [Rehmannia glutinosa]|uniref:F-box domain-containing protein n=1 Tax=Rehmannia glutinosa TaxID=99300 RepID=A0ABR0UK84_REHGL